MTSTVPGMSSVVAVGSLDSSTAYRVTAAATTPIGTLIQKTADQSTWSTRKPPSSGPSASPSDEMPAQIPIAVATCLRGNAVTMIESESGFMSAPPEPCTARAMISWWSFVASAHAAELRVKMASPTRNMRFRPKRSPSLPPSRISAANVRTYALIVHSRLSWFV